MNSKQPLELTEDEIKQFARCKRILFIATLVLSGYCYFQWFSPIDVTIIAILSIWYVVGGQSVILNGDTDVITKLMKQDLAPPMIAIKAVDVHNAQSLSDYVVGFLGGFAILLFVFTASCLLFQQRFIRCERKKG